LEDASGAFRLTRGGVSAIPFAQLKSVAAQPDRTHFIDRLALFDGLMQEANDHGKNL
jgi:hypothetical protein